MIAVLIKRRSLGRDRGQRKDGMKKHRKRIAIHKQGERSRVDPSLSPTLLI
jgi:hypothetical protein